MTVTLNLDHVHTDQHTRRTLSDISLFIAKRKKIVVVTGAGISCSCGVPDFRSSDGLYAMVKEQYPDVVLKGRDLFDAALFRDPTSTAVFYTFIAQLKRSIDAAEPAPTHRFIKILDTKKKLLRSYTQNIDGFEARVGLLGSSCHEAKSDKKGKSKIRIRDIRNVQLHGDIHRVRCMACSADYPCSEEYLRLFQQGKAPECPECSLRSKARVARSARAIRVGSLRPGIVLYDESHPLGDDIGIIHTADLGKKPDMLIIMGTSLKVHGLKKLVKDFARTIHSTPTSSTPSTSKKSFKVIFVNKTPPGSEWADIIDYHIAGETDAWTTKVIDDWKKMRPNDWELQQTLVSGVDENSMSGGLQSVKPRVGSTSKNKPRGRENLPPGTTDMSLTDDLFLASKPSVPLSPSKRRQKSSHYDDVNSSPSKRLSMRLKGKYFVPEEERKLLFTNATNLPPDPVVNGSDGSKMSITFEELPVCIQQEINQTMDISRGDISMKADEPALSELSQARSTKTKRSSTLLVKSQVLRPQVVTSKKVVAEKKQSRKRTQILARS